LRQWRKDRISLLKKNRLLETASFHLRDAHGWSLKPPGPQSAVGELVPLLSANAYRPIKSGEHTYWCFALAVRISSLGAAVLAAMVQQGLQAIMPKVIEALT
jgi:hypothetical protein